MATIIKGKVDALSRRDGTKGPYWYVKINGTDYYCGDPRIADKEGTVISAEHYQTKSGRDAIRLLNNNQDPHPPQTPAQDPPACSQGGPGWTRDQLEKAFSCRTMSMSYAKDLVGRAYEGVPRPAGPGKDMTDLVKAITLDTLRVYMVLHDTIARGTDLPGAEKLFLDTKVGGSPNVKAESGAEPATAEQRKEIIELCANLGLVPVRASKKYIGRAIKNMADLTAAEATIYIDALKTVLESGEKQNDDVPF
ncbi:MAG TPA: hypothetical protein P5244_11035 [Syntrophales bacterium]|nr:hypothetical protein [Syntrophales bacterium]